MYLNKINTIQEFREYCLRRLGSPVINLELDDQQIQDRISDAIDFFVKGHVDGSTEGWWKYELTELDETFGFIHVPDEIFSIVEIFDARDSGSTSHEEFEQVNFLLKNSDIVGNLTSPGRYGSSSERTMTEYHMTQTHIDMLKRFLIPVRTFSFNQYTHKLEFKSGEIFAGSCIWINGHKAVTEDIQDADSVKDYLNDDFLKDYATALIKLQWGSNVRKYDGVQLPGGITLRGEDIYQDAKRDVEKLKEDFQNQFDHIPFPMWG